MYKTKLTTQGTITIPAELRRKYDLKPGEVLAVEDTGEIVVSKVPRLSEVREKNKGRIGEKRGSYIQGDGFVSHITEEYGKK